MKIDLVILLFLAVLVSGCKKPENADSGKNGSQSTSSRTRHPESVDELKKTFSTAFDSGDKAAIERLIYWKNMDEGNRSGTRMYLIADAGKQRIIEIESKECRPGEYPPEHWTLEFTHKLDIVYGEDAENSTTFSWPYGKQGGKLYFAAFDPDASQ